MAWIKFRQAILFLLFIVLFQGCFINSGRINPLVQARLDSLERNFPFEAYPEVEYLDYYIFAHKNTKDSIPPLDIVASVKVKMGYDIDNIRVFQDEMIDTVTSIILDGFSLIDHFNRLTVHLFTQFPDQSGTGRSINFSYSMSDWQRMKELGHLNQENYTLSQDNIPPNAQLIVDYYPNGQKRMEGYYVDGKVEGIYTTWFSNGEIESQMEYLNGMKHGLHIDYYENGQMYRIMIYKYNNFVRDSMKWDKYGNIILEEN